MSRWDDKRQLHEELDQLLARHNVRVGGYYRLSDAPGSAIYRREPVGAAEGSAEDLRRLIDTIRRDGLWRY